ncbi:MAG TPA: thioesterase family protein [Acidimicrobiia bacterium]|nr:thioesterase family protein [Acidimicrobiia bacterium]
MTSAFEEDTAVTAEGSGVYRALVTDRWSIGGRPNGGYLMGIVLRAIAEESGMTEPLTTTAHFLAPADPGPTMVSVEMVKKGRTVSTARATLSQGDRQKVLLMVTLGDLDAQSGPTQLLSSPPHLPSDLVSSQGRPAPHPIVERFEFLLPTEQAQVADGVTTPQPGRAEFAGKIRFADGYQPTLLALPLLVDAYPPAIFNLGLIGWTPTLELTVHTRGRPQGEWFILRVHTRFLINGTLDEDAELWNEDGTLVAQSRQLARVLVLPS